MYNMGKFGIKTTSAPFNINTLKKNELNISSEFTSFKVFKKGVISITTDGTGGGSGQVAHGLGFMPTFYVFRMGTASWQETLTGVDSNSYTNAFFPNPSNYSSWINYHDATTVYAGTGSLFFSIIGAANTTYSFKYYIFSDLGIFYSGNSGLNTGNSGIKVSKQGKDITKVKDYDLSFSSKFKNLQYDRAKSGQNQLTLPAIAGSQFSDPNPQEATYIDIFHGLGYPPFFLAFAINPSSLTVGSEIPTTSAVLANVEKVDAWCDATRLRISWWRKASYSNGLSWSAGTLKIKWLIFNEDLRL